MPSVAPTSADRPLDDIEVPAEVIENWQNTVDILARISGTPAALIMRVHPEEIEVFVSSKSEGNVYHPGERVPLDAGLYCEAVMSSRRELLVPNALKDPRWDRNPDIALGMISYCGLPILWPGGQVFGTICILDTRENGHSTLIRDLLALLREDVQFTLRTLRDTFKARRSSSEATESAMISEGRFRLLFDQATDAAFVVERVAGAGPVIRDANQAACRLLGYTREELLGWTGSVPALAFPLGGAPRTPGSGHQAGMNSPIEMEHRSRDGSIRKFECSVSELEIGGRSYATVVQRDVTERKLAAKALGESEARLKLAMRGGALGLWDWDVPSGRVVLDGHWSEILGYSPGEIEPHVSTWERFVHPDDLPRVRAALEAHLRGETEAYSTEHRVRHKDGHWVWILDSGLVVERSPDGAALRATGTHTDITSRKLAEDVLARSEARYRGLFESMMDGFVLVGMDGLIRESNEVYRQMLGYSAAELAETKYTDLTPQAWHAAEARIVAEQVLPRGYSDVYEKEYRRKDGTVFPVEIRVFLLKDGDRPLAMWAIVRDITARRRAAEALNSLQAQLALTSRLAALGTLVAGVAHEINNPLAAALSDQDLAMGGVRALQDRLRGSVPLDREAESQQLQMVVEELGEAQDAGRRIERIVKALKTFGRPNHENARERVRLIDVVDLAMRWLPATIAQTATITVENGGAPDVLVTPGQIAEVVASLVTNAAKATVERARGVIVVRVGPGKAGMARMEVIDHGTGIKPAVLPRIFEPFFTTSDVGKGTGLGLSICHAIVTGHGGTITVESEVGRGSTFRVELPAASLDA